MSQFGVFQSGLPHPAHLHLALGPLLSPAGAQDQGSRVGGCLQQTGNQVKLILLYHFSRRLESEVSHEVRLEEGSALIPPSRLSLGRCRLEITCAPVSIG